MHIAELELVASGISLPIEERDAKIGILELASAPAAVNTDGTKPVTATKPKFVAGGEAEKLMPKDSDFIAFPFRALSATTVAAYTWRATEFPASVLKASVPLLNGQTAFTNHWDDPEESIGLSENSSWQEATVQNGVQIPAGINTDIKVDCTINAEMARKMLTGEVCCASVKVKFEWKPSHQFEREWDFYEQLGEIQPDGTMCRRIATKILGYQEISIVNVGADPTAGMLDADGNLRKLDSSQLYNVAGFSATETQKPTSESQLTDNICAIGLNAAVLMLSKSDKPQAKPQDMNTEKAKEQEFALKMKEANDNLALRIVEISQLEAKLLTSTKELAEVTKKLADATISAQKWELQLSKKRGEVAAMYSKLSSEPSEAIIALINKANEDELAAFEKEYAAKAQQLFSFKCKSCNGTEYSLQSSSEQGEKNEPKIQKEVPPFADINFGSN